MVDKYADAVYGTRGGPFRNSHWGGMTYRGKTLYIHVWDWKLNTLTLPALDAQILEVSSPTAQELHHAVHNGRLTFSVGAEDRLALDTILCVQLDRDVKRAY